MFKAWIDQIRDTLSGPPRRLPAGSYPYVTPPMPDWMRHVPSEPLTEQYRQHTLLFEQGMVGWAALVQANSMLFEPSEVNAMPALALFSPDAYFDEAVEELREIAHEIFGLREARPKAKALKAVVKQMDNEERRYGRRLVPPELARGRRLFLTDLMVHREHLPGGCLDGGAFPILHHPETSCIWIVPARFWPDDLTECWHEL